MWNYKYLELVPIPKELCRHTDISFDGSHTAFEDPCVGTHQSFWLVDLAAIFVQNSLQQPEMSGVET